MTSEVQRPRRNRVTPFGTLERSNARGAIMGNRGDLHGPDGEIVRLWRLKRWITCTTIGKDGHRVTFDRPGQYAPLFALDEATMLAAGHRPCAQCRPEALARFKAAWARAQTMPDGYALSAVALDEALHAARLDGQGGQRTHRARACDLPAGVMVAIPHPADPSRRVAWLIGEGCMRLWSHDGYGTPEPIATAAMVDVLTPAPVIAALRAGYMPEFARGT